MLESQQFMEEAIQKASKLIQLLKKENQQFREENHYCKKMIQEKQSVKTKLKAENTQLKLQERGLREKLERKQAQHIQMKDRIAILQAKVQDKSLRNQQLHGKIGDLTAKLQLVTKNFERQKKRNMSLSNENQYLFKLIDQHKSKENQFQNTSHLTKNEFMKELETVQRTKQAFSRKWEQLKSENILLRSQLNDSNYNCTELQARYRIALEKISRQKDAQNTLKKVEDSLSYIIESTLKIKEEQSLYDKVQQINNFLEYRFQHIEKLFNSIFQCFEKCGIMHDAKFIKVRDLENMNALTNRLLTYISQLLK